MVETRLILLNALYADGEAFACKGFGCQTAACVRRKAAVDGIDNEGPVHHFVAVKQVAVEDELKSGVFAVTGITSRGAIQFQLCRERLEPVMVL